MKPDLFIELAELLPEPAFLLTPSGTILATNSAAASTLGGSGTNPANQKLTAFVSNSEDQVQQFLRSCAGSNRRVIGALSLIANAGEGVSCRCEGGRLQSGDSDFAFNIFLRCIPKQQTTIGFVALNKKIDELNLEIQQRKRSEEALSRNREVLSSIINNAPAMISIKDLEGRYVLINRHYEELFGMDNGKIKGLSDLDVFPLDVAEVLRANDESVIRKNKAMRWEEVISHNDGIHTYLSIKFPLHDEQAKPYAVCSISSDISSMKRAEEKIRNFNRELEARVEARTEELNFAYKELEAFSYSVSHDLRTPLRGIDGFSQALIEDYEDVLDATGKGYLQRIRAATQKMGNLIDDLLSLSRIGRTEPDYTDVDLSNIAHDIFSQLSRTYPNRNVTAQIQHNVFARGDASLLRVALENLINNAWKFTANRDSAHIEFGCRNEEAGTVYYIKDNGVGFDMQYADKLFSAFQRLHNASEFEGTGVGLATVKRVIERHSGRIWVESKPGEGTTFLFSLGKPRAITIDRIPIKSQHS